MARVRLRSSRHRSTMSLMALFKRVFNAGSLSIVEMAFASPIDRFMRFHSSSMVDAWGIRSFLAWTLARMRRGNALARGRRKSIVLCVAS